MTNLDFDEVCELVTELSALAFFPTDPAGRLAVARLIGEMAHNMEQVRWLIRRMTSGIYNKWHGPQEMRACFCQRFKPRDGLSVFSSVFSVDEGSPFPEDPEVKRAALPPAIPPLALPPGHVTADAQMQQAVEQVARWKGMPKPRRISTTELHRALADILAGPNDRREQIAPADSPEDALRKATLREEINQLLAERRVKTETGGEPPK